MKAEERRTVRNRGAHRAQAAMGWILSLIAVALVLYVLFELWLVPARIAGDSMQPALANGDVVLTDRLAKYWKTPGRGDVVSFYDPASGTLLLKRIVGLPGEVVDIVSGRVYVNGRPLDESQYAIHTDQCADMEPLAVPEGAVFVLSDNRIDAYDSRDERVGCVAFQSIDGLLRFRILPATRLAFYY